MLIFGGLSAAHVLRLWRPSWAFRGFNSAGALVSIARHHMTQSATSKRLQNSLTSDSSELISSFFLSYFTLCGPKMLRWRSLRATFHLEGDASTGPTPTAAPTRGRVCGRGFDASHNILRLRCLRLKTSFNSKQAVSTLDELRFSFRMLHMQMEDLQYGFTVWDDEDLFTEICRERDSASWKSAEGPL